MAEKEQMYVAGRFVDAEDATVSALDAGLLLGAGLFETLRIYGGRPFRLGAHLARLRESLDRGDVEELAREAHTIKGSAANFGATAMPDLALRLESMGCGGALEGALDAIEAIEAEFERVRAFLGHDLESRPR